MKFTKLSRLLLAGVMALSLFGTNVSVLAEGDPPEEGQTEIIETEENDDSSVEKNGEENEGIIEVPDKDVVSDDAEDEKTEDEKNESDQVSEDVKKERTEGSDNENDDFIESDAAPENEEKTDGDIDDEAEALVKEEAERKGLRSFRSGNNDRTLSEATFIDGSSFNRTIRLLSGDSNWNILNNVNNTIKSIERSDNLPSDGIDYQDVSADKDESILVWFDGSDGTIYWYSPAETVYLNANAKAMFQNLSKVESIDTEDFNTSRVNTLSSLFHACYSITAMNISDWDVSNVTDMSYLFNWCNSLSSIDISCWDVSNAKNMKGMFNNCYALDPINISDWDVSSVENMSIMFSGCSFQTIEISKWNVGHVTDMSGMFKSSSLTSLDISTWDFSAVQDMSEMFSSCVALPYINVADWNVGNVETFKDMFNRCSSLSNLDVSKWNVSNAKIMSGMFKDCTSLERLDVSAWDVSSVTDMSSMFSGDRKITFLDVSEWDTGNVTTMSYMFGDSDIIDIDTSKWNVSQVKDMSNMFHYCFNLPYVNVSAWDVGNVETFSHMFDGCYSLDGIDVSNWNVSSAKDMSYMFSGCHSLTSLDVSNWDVSSVATMYEMFKACSALEFLDVSRWNVSNVVDMDYLFSDCVLLAGLDVSNWDTASVVGMNGLFGNCELLAEIDVSKWNTSSATGMAGMFGGCKKLKQLDLLNFDTSKVTNMNDMFGNCESIERLDLISFDTSKVISMKGMFSGDISLKYLNLHSFDTIGIAYPYDGNQPQYNPGLHKMFDIDSDQLRTLILSKRMTGANGKEFYRPEFVMDSDVTWMRSIENEYMHVADADGNPISDDTVYSTKLDMYKLDDAQLAGTWEKYFTVTYHNVNDEDFKDGIVSGFTAVSPSLTLKNPSRENYEFLGWTENEGDTPQLTVTIETGTEENKVYTANWKKNVSTITYVVGEHGTGEFEPQEKVANVDVALHENTPIGIESLETYSVKFAEETGLDPIDYQIGVKYDFNHWNGSDDKEYQPGQIFTGNYDLTLTAEYDETPVKGKITLPDAEKEGYDFDGWADPNDEIVGGPNDEWEVPDNWNPDDKLTPKYTAHTYTVSYDTGEQGEADIENQIKTHDIALVLSNTVPTGKTFLNDYFLKFDYGVEPMKYQIGYKAIFVNWKGDDNTSYNAGDTFIGNYNLLLSAQYDQDPIRATITLPNAEKEGHTFKGWEDPDGNPVGNPGDEWTIPDDWNPDKDELIGIWERNTFTITYSAGKHGTAEIPDGTKQYGADYTISEVIPVGSTELNTFAVKFDWEGVEPIPYQKGIQFTFDHWAGDDEHEYLPSGKFEGNYDLNLIAKYSDKPVITSIILPNAEKEGYRFVGWEDPDGKPVGTVGDEWTPYEDWDPENDKLTPVFRSETQEVIISIDTYLDDNLYSGSEFRFEIKNKNGDVLGTITDLVNGRGSCEIIVPSFEDTTVTISQIPGNNVMMNYDKSVVEKTISHIYE